MPDEVSVLVAGLVVILAFIPVFIVLRILHRKINKSGKLGRNVSLVLFFMLVLAYLAPMVSESLQTEEIIILILILTILLPLSLLPSLITIISNAGKPKKEEKKQLKARQEVAESELAEARRQAELHESIELEKIRIQKNLELEKLRKDAELSKVKLVLESINCIYCSTQYKSSLTECPSCGAKNQ